MLTLYQALTGKEGLWERHGSQTEDLTGLMRSWNELQSTKGINELFEAELVSAILESLLIMDHYFQEESFSLNYTYTYDTTVREALSSLVDKIDTLIFRINPAKRIFPITMDQGI